MLDNNNTPIVGVKLLNMLMLQLYSNPRCIYREYIQNSLDSINEAVRCGILHKVNDGLVNITINENDIVIEDNGTGIPKERAVKLLTDIANSVKSGIDTAGQFGVGRLSGGGYCELLEFQTTYQGEDESTIVSMDTNVLRQLLESDYRCISTEDAKKKICSVNYDYAEKEEHHFILLNLKVKNFILNLRNDHNRRVYVMLIFPSKLRDQK